MNNKYNHLNNKKNMFKDTSTIIKPHHVIELNITHFPELSCATTKTNDKNNMEYMLKLNKPLKTDTSELENNGHVTFFFDKKSRSIVVNNNKIFMDTIHNKNINFQSLILKWERYYNLYNEIYGEEIYEKMYLFPNYNYEYFDTLDDNFYMELYKEEQLYNEENESLWDEDYY